MAQKPQRTRFSPVRWDPDDPASIPALQGETGTVQWTPLVHCSADFPAELFEAAISQLIHHPEYNSTLILRSETVSDTVLAQEHHSALPKLQGHLPLRNVHRRLLPRRPGRDEGIEQHCTLYGSTSQSPGESVSPSVLVLSPIVPQGRSLPYYHPTVHHLALRYVTTDIPSLQIEVVPLPGTQLDIGSRLYRTCLALLDALHRYGWGAMTDYRKRVLHDRIVPRELYQDLYLVMRERHKHLVNTWQETTDPLKHVFEDIGIATFLMLLWKDMYKTDCDVKAYIDVKDYEDQPWRKWPQPPAGFVDLGCGNGLLTHILTAEGYQGHGLDVRARTSWAHYPESTQTQLHVYALDPTTENSFGDEHEYMRPGSFIIGNHADELTPWVPVLSTLHKASGYLSIPCCSWVFDSRFERSKFIPYPTPMTIDEFADSLYLGGDGDNKSTYSSYRIWLASLSLYCGWKVECETLRIPSTRNWALVGRKHKEDDFTNDAIALEHVQEILKQVRERGIFRARHPEGKAGDH